MNAEPGIAGQDRPVNIGMIGAGFIGQLGHLMNYVESARCKVLALAEFRPELRRRVCARFEIPRSYETHRELLADRDVDAVVVVTPRSYTAPIVLDCLEAGKHVMSEKPMAGTADQAERLVAAAATRGLCYAVGYMKRHDEGVQLAKALLDGATKSGELGSVLFARSHCYMGDSYCSADGHVVTEERAVYKEAGWPVAPEWLPADQSPAFAAFVNTFSHNTNLLRYFFDRTPRVEYSNLSGAPGQLAVLNFGAFNATLETGRSSNRGWDEVTEIYFADGRLIVRTPPALLKNVSATVELYKAGMAQEVIVPQPTWTWSFRRQAESFIRDVREKTQPLSSGADAIEDLLLIEQLWRLDLGRNG